MRHAVGALALVLVATRLVGCGDPNEPVVGEATPEPMQSPVDDRCEEPDEEVIERIEGRLDVEAELKHAREVASEDDGDLVFVAAELVGDLLDDEAPIGTWTIRDDGADVASVSAVARYHSSWPDATRRDGRVTMETDGAKEVETCVEAATE